MLDAVSDVRSRGVKPALAQIQPLPPGNTDRKACELPVRETSNALSRLDPAAARILRERKHLIKVRKNKIK